jgi:TolB protein
VTRDDSASLWVVPATGGQPERIPTPLANNFEPAWSPDSHWICFTGESDDGTLRIRAVRPDGSGLRQMTGGARDQACTWRPA